MTTLIIKPLNECPEHINELAKLWYKEIREQWVPHSSLEQTKESLFEHAKINEMPMAFIALVDNKPIGMACLRENDGIREDLAPWLGSLVVNPEFRNRKVGEMLINSIKIKAKELGHKMLYLLAFDPTIPNWYKRLGWSHIGDDQLFGHTVTVMSISI